MIMEKETRELILNGYKYYLPHLSIDCVIFGYHDNQLKILLIKLKNLNDKCLPGGYIKHSEILQQAANRILKERTGLEKIFLQQFETFGDPERTKMFDQKKISAISGIKLSKDNWMMGRFVSIGYYAIVEYSKVSPTSDAFSEECMWCDIHKVPRLLFDHNEMIVAALKTLRLHLYHQPIGYNLLPEKFTLPEIHTLYETILDKTLDRRNFPKKLLSLGIIKKLNEQRNIGAHRSPFLYRFDKRKYDEALKNGIVIAF
jgi:ADP-ribose pyrophosphatase YjhB (NUDIX family)